MNRPSVLSRAPRVPPLLDASVLDNLARQRLLVALDFDGTLAPLVADRERATMRAETASQLAALCHGYPTAVISGRARADVARRLTPAQPRLIVGNHGAEWTDTVGAGPATIRRAAALLHTRLPAPMQLEDKSWSLSVHLHPQAAHAEVLSAVPMLAEWLGPLLAQVHLQPGHRVVNIRPSDAPHKGDALIEARRQTGMDHVLFIGDDETDEDAFRLPVSWLTGIRIGPVTETAASYVLAHQHDIDALLARLVAARTPRATSVPR
jgi:trehalose 6-phosphate phosphatase